MRSSKRYTNVTFTKRVDHEAGRHRTPRAPAEPRVCTECGAAYVKRRWVAAETPRAAAIGGGTPATRVFCPTCRQRQAGLPCGFVHLDGPFVSTHLDEIERLLRNESDRAALDNPTARVMTWDRAQPGVLELTTTTPHLAQRLGHALEKAFSGDIRYDFSHENRVARVTWHRD